MAERVPDLLSDETLTINGRRGVLYTVREAEPPYETGETVVIRGARWTVTAVERHAIANYDRNGPGLPCGLLVVPA